MTVYRPSGGSLFGQMKQGRGALTLMLGEEGMAWT